MVRGRWLVIGLWAVLAVGSLTLLPSPAPSGGGLSGFLPDDSPAIRVEVQSLSQFAFPLLARTEVVQRDPAGLSVAAQSRALARAAAANRGDYGNLYPILGVLPLPNTMGAFPGSRESGTTVINYLFMSPYASLSDSERAARRFVAEHFDAQDHVVGVTGSVPARAEQSAIIQDSLPTVEIVTLIALVLIVGLSFRSLMAPALTLAVAGTSVVITTKAVGVGASWIGVSAPSELRPLLVALQLGIVTDYVIFFLSGLRTTMTEVADTREAVCRSAADVAPIVAVAGVTVAAGTAALLASSSGLFRAMGPGMALAVLVALVVSISLVPALMAVLGRVVFWPLVPGLPAAGGDGARPAGRIGPAGTGSAQLSALVSWRRTPLHWLQRQVGRRLGADGLTRPRTAAVVLVVTVAGLLAAAVPALHLQLGAAFVPSLPVDNKVRAVAQAAEAGFSDGILSPTMIVVSGPGITAKRGELAELRRRIEVQPGVAGVVGPGLQPLPQDLGVVYSQGGDAARLLVIMSSQPLGASAIGSLRDLQQAMPGLLAQVGLVSAQVGYAGDTALAAEIVGNTTDDLFRIAVAALLVNALILVIFLRALVAPILLLVASVLALLASLGITTWLFQDRLGQDGLTFYVPFAAAVLLVALGSDYNIFGVGHIWSEARVRPLTEAIRVALPESTRAISVAAVTLAASLGLLAVVPLDPFRQLGFALAVGIMLDALVVRSLLMPSMLTLMGTASGWPWARLRPSPARAGPRLVAGARSARATREPDPTGKTEGRTGSPAGRPPDG